MEVDKYNLCAIIDACAKGGVSEMKFGGIQIQFFRQEAKEKTTEPSGPQYQMSSRSKGAGAQYADTPADVFDPDVVENLRINQLMINDPHGFEQEIIDSHLSR